MDLVLPSTVFEIEERKMNKSMTGYGRARETLDQRDITVEVRSVNNRYLDCGVKLPRAYTFAEDAVRKRIQKAVSRGKVDVLLTIASAGAETAKVTVDRNLAESFKAALMELSEICGTKCHVTAQDLARFPDVLSVTKAEEDLDALTADICQVLDLALVNYNAMRQAEGKRLAEDISKHLDIVVSLTEKVEERSPQTVAAYRQKLTARLEEVLQNATIDPQRILTEAAIYADKVAVDEETVRLRSHVLQFREMLESQAPMGRKMDFLVQEINRESNTIGSKCCDLSIAQAAVDLKAEVEKIREQVQNVE
jgi:uncharacterized protein (TIGR00255 family)